MPKPRKLRRDHPAFKRLNKGHEGKQYPYYYYLAPVVAVLVGFISALYWTSGVLDGTESAASVGHKYDRVAFNVNCSADYENETFHECIPKKCRRVVMDNLISEEEATQLLNVARNGLSLGGSNGGASILDLHSGALSKGNQFVNVYSLLDGENVNKFTEADFALYRKVKNRIHQTIAKEFDIPASELYLTKPTFFSRMDTKEARTVHDEYWHAHIDKETYGSFHYTSLLYLTTYNTDFTGGRFIFVDKDVNKTVEPQIGRVSFFTSGSENVHYVEKLRSGTRFAITISFTCDPQEAIVDPRLKRQRQGP